MLVVKFGGTSVGKPERMKKIANLVTGMPGRCVTKERLSESRTRNSRPRKTLSSICG